tara:strand:+ start:35 stop:499 length:465 start_codon:yes stop_codon:yes gene_type:complete
MKRSVTETILGAVVIVVAGLFLAYSLKSANVSASDGYVVMADFSGIGGLAAGDDVQISGVKVGHVLDVELLPQTYLARVHIYVKNGYELPTDTAALITSKSLLGGTLLALEPGAEEELLENGDRIEYTQAPQNLEQLLGQFIFSMQNDDDDNAE